MKNIVIVLFDGMRKDRMAQLPRFSQLIQSSTYFSNIVTYYPGTIGSMHSIFTGSYGRNTGVDNYWASPLFKSQLYKVLPLYFQERGYFTWGDIINDMIIPKIGFDELTVHDEFKDDLFSLHRNMIRDVKGKAKEKPFLLYLHYSYIHTNTTKNFIKNFEGEFDARFYDKSQRKQEYDSYLKQADDYLGLILKTLSEENLDEDTIFIALSDHGCGNGEKFGERRYGFYCYHYTLGTFMLIHGSNLPVKEYPQLARTIDILPTILDIAGIPRDGSFAPFDGKSMMPVVQGVEKAGRVAFSETAGSDGYKPKEPRTKTTITAVTTDDWKYIFNMVTGGKELYSLKDDIQEEHNLAGKGLEIEQELHNQLMDFLNKNLDNAVKDINLEPLNFEGSQFKEYLEINKKTFQELAHEYQGRWESSLAHQKTYLNTFIHLIKKQFPSRKVKVIDIGCGVGIDLYLLAKEGFDTSGLDFSEHMLQYTKNNSPDSKIIHADILEFTSPDVYDGVVLDAFIHLFPEEDCKVLLNCVKNLLVQGGICFISTTKHTSSFEGYLTKLDYGKQFVRYRKQWVKDDLKRFLEENGFEVLLQYDDEQQHLGKKWMNFVLRRL
ncbi:MAG TPA: sulfatase-like hydrolase/transferase [Candidatus Nanoarchaeia archaeon]|nr:sulfatase-like hydrolase/transferase [Candidatus Nanoarchaeia archaeon]